MCWLVDEMRIMEFEGVDIEMLDGYVIESIN